MRTSRAAVRAGVTVVLALAAAASVPAADGDFCAAVRMVPVGGDAVGLREEALQPRTSRYSARQVVDLQLRTSIQGELRGTHLLELELYTPHGNLYQVLTAAVTVGAADERREVAVPGYPRPLPLQRLQPVRPHGEEGAGWVGEAVLLLPVAGTLIVQSSLYGTWEIVPRLDGAVMSCERRILFQIVR